MGLVEFLDGLDGTPERIALDTAEFRREFENDFKLVIAGTPQHLALLDLWQSVFNMAEHRLQGQDRDAFSKARKQYYRTFIVRECLIGDQVSPKLLDIVTLREVTAGRMAPDYEGRKIAAAGPQPVHNAAAPKGWRKMFAWANK